MGLIAIRGFREADWPRLQAIHDAARMDELRLAGLEGAFLPLSVAAQREGLFEYTLRVAELDGTAAGFAAFTPDELAWLYVDPALARRGVGRALVEDALERMERPVSIEVLEGNGPALALYLGCGFPGGGDRLRADAGQRGVLRHLPCPTAGLNRLRETVGKGGRI